MNRLPISIMAFHCSWSTYFDGASIEAGLELGNGKLMVDQYEQEADIVDCKTLVTEDKDVLP